MAQSTIGPIHWNIGAERNCLETHQGTSEKKKHPCKKNSKSFQLYQEKGKHTENFFQRTKENLLKQTANGVLEMEQEQETKKKKKRTQRNTSV